MRRIKSGLEVTVIVTTNAHDHLRVNVLLDRLQVASEAPRLETPPRLKGFRVVSDHWVRPQTDIPTYARSREYRSTRNSAQIFWQYKRRCPWLKPWKITLIADDRFGLTPAEVWIDTSLPHGEMVFQIIGAIAQWERALIVERVKAGLQHARSQGRRLGRPPLRVLTPEEVINLRKERFRTKAPFRTLARKYGVSIFTAHTLCARPALRGSSHRVRR